MEVPSVIPTTDECVYTSCYCEENVWKLCDLVKKRCGTEELNKSYAVFISNENRSIPLWHHKNTVEGRPVVWDYHVIFIYKRNDDSLVFDQDSSLSFPTPFQEYVASCIGKNDHLKQNFWRMFRVIPAPDFLSRFASDRTHMLKEDGTWLAPPPDYPPIGSQESCNNLQDLISMDATNGFGRVCTLEEFSAFF